MSKLISSQLITNKSEFVLDETLMLSGMAIIEGVLNRELVLEDELIADDWLDVPSTDSHPKIICNDKEVKVSATSQEGQKFVVGSVVNAEKRDRGLFLDVVLNTDFGLKSGDVVEVSTAYYRDFVEEAGVFKDKPYDRRVINIRPDHVAILRHEQGACSIEDGCGLVVNQEKDNSCMIALYPSLTDAHDISIPDGLNPEELHVTLAFLGDLKVEQKDLLDFLFYVASNNFLIRASLNGIIRFSNDDNLDPFCLSVDSFALCKLRELLVRELKQWLGVEVIKNHGFTPHMTLAYILKDAIMPFLRVEPREIVFNKIGLAWDDQVTLFSFKGEDRMNESQNSIQEAIEDMLAPLSEKLEELASSVQELITNTHANTDALQCVTERLNKQDKVEIDGLVSEIVANSIFSADDLKDYNLDHLRKIHAMSPVRSARHYAPKTTTSTRTFVPIGSKKKDNV